MHRSGLPDEESLIGLTEMHFLNACADAFINILAKDEGLARDILDF